MKLRVLFLFSFLLVPVILFGQDTVKTYVNNDVTSIFSTHPDRPFKYGYPYTREEIWEGYKSKFDAYEINSGMIVASVGAASGWMEGMFSVFSDNVTYYIQDIQDQILNQEQLDAVVTHFSGQRETQQTNTFEWVLGTETETKLPDGIFDLVIVNNTFHEFGDPESMIRDLSSKLKPEGRIVVGEHFSNSEWIVKHKGCNIKAYEVSDVKEMFEQEGLFLTKAWLPESANLNYLTFQKNKIKGKEYEQMLQDLSKETSALESLLDKKVLNNSTEMLNVENILEDGLPALYSAYPNFHFFFKNLAEHYLDRGKFEFAHEVLNTLDFLVSFEPEVAAIRGDVYYEAEQYGQASEQYYNAIKWDNSDIFRYADLIFTYSNMNYFREGMEVYRKARVIDSTDSYLNSALGNLFLDMYYYEEEYPFKIHSEESKALFGKEIKTKEEALEYAITGFSTAIESNPLDPDFHLSRAKANEELGEYEKAIADYDRMLYLNPNNLSIYRLRAKAKLYSGNEAGHDADLQEMKRVKKELKKR